MHNLVCRYCGSHVSPLDAVCDECGSRLSVLAPVHYYDYELPVDAPEWPTIAPLPLGRRLVASAGRIASRAIVGIVAPILAVCGLYCYVTL